MMRLTPFVYAVFSMATLHAAAAAAPDSIDAGRKIFQSRCQSCHGGAAPADSAIGPSLAGIYGRKAASQSSGVHSRAAVESGTVWTRKSLRRYLSDPGQAMPGTLMPVQVGDSKELDDLLDYLKTLR